MGCEIVDAEHPRLSHRELPAGYAVRLSGKVGVDRIRFGSDGPGRNPIDIARQVVALDRTESDKQKILGKNAKAYLGLR